jgi:hypothetical protein
MYCDVHMPKDPPHPFVKCPMENMPFGDKEFDYARCWHVIEHTQDPDMACKELIRIAKAGILAFPPPQAEACYGRKEHRWHVYIDRHRLVFIPKFYESLGFPRRIAGGALNATFEWEDSFEWLTLRPKSIQLRPPEYWAPLGE